VYLTGANMLPNTTAQEIWIQRGTRIRGPDFINVLMGSHHQRASPAGS
jgi:hypothetical protein